MKRFAVLIVSLALLLLSACTVEQEKAALRYGKTENGRYYNESASLCFVLPPDWEQRETAWDMEAQRTDGTACVGVLLQSLGELSGEFIDGEQYRELMAGRVEADMEKAGYAEISVEERTAALRGKSIPALYLTAQAQVGENFFPYYMLLCYERIGNDVLTVTVQSFYADETEALLALFTAA